MQAPGLTPPPHIARIERKTLQVSPKSCWIFLSVICSDGHVGHGEATMEGHETAVIAALDRLVTILPGSPAAPAQCRPLNFLSAIGHTSHAYTALSALDQALWDAEGHRAGLGVSALLSDSPRPVRLYANVNRGIATRSPEGFAKAASLALADGYSMIKIAPFDGLDWRQGREDDTTALYESGLDRIAAVRDALGGKAALAVDCHWRFDNDSATQLITDLRAMDLYWLECPLPEPPDAVPDLRRLRGLCAAAGTRLAGLENANGLDAARPFIEGGAYDIIMPDVKYAGGISECLRIARAADLCDVLCSPHNPTGPICHAASLHLAAALANCPVLEHQFRETPLFDTIVDDRFAGLTQGHTTPPPGPGFGVPLHLERAEAAQRA